MSRRRVAITGIGVVSTIGVGTPAAAAGLRQGRSGVRFLPERRDLGFRSALSGVIDPFTPRFPLSQKARKTMPDFAVWAHEAAMEAVAMAALGDDLLRSPRTGLVFGNDSTAAAAHDQASELLRRGNTAALHSGMVFRAMNSSVTMNLCSILGTQGAAWTLSGACASGGHAVGQAAELIAQDRQDRVLCGGAQEIAWETVCSFDALCAFSTREAEPERASRPFDAGRDGLVPSGGAAALVLEDMEQAGARGASVLGEILAYAFSSDGANIALTTGEGLTRCMAEVLTRAGAGRDSVDLIIAHGTSTPLGDAVEAEAIDTVFGPFRPWVISTKSQTGHEMWMSGASQAVYAALMAHGGFIAGSRNFEQPDERTACLRVLPETVGGSPENVLVNSAGFGGTNCCLLLRFGA